MNSPSQGAVRLTAWAAILGGVFAYMNVGFMVAVTQGDMSVTQDGALMLALPAEAHSFFRWSMFADILGFYLPLIAVGGYMWAAFRREAGAFGDMAALAILTYVILGVAGAGIQLAALNPLVEVHASGSDSARTAAEVAWTTVATISQLGLWWCEGPVVLFWGLVVLPHLKRAGWGASILMPLKVVGWCFGLYFLAGFFPQLGALCRVLLIVVVLVFPMWLILFGAQLRGRVA